MFRDRRADYENTEHGLGSASRYSRRESTDERAVSVRTKRDIINPVTRAGRDNAAETLRGN